MNFSDLTVIQNGKFIITLQTSLLPMLTLSMCMSTEFCSIFVIDVQVLARTRLTMEDKVSFVFLADLQETLYICD